MQFDRPALAQALTMRTAPPAVTISASSRFDAAVSVLPREAAEPADLHKAADADRQAAAALDVAAAARPNRGWHLLFGETQSSSHPCRWAFDATKIWSSRPISGLSRRLADVLSSWSWKRHPHAPRLARTKSGFK